MNNTTLAPEDDVDVHVDLFEFMTEGVLLTAVSVIGCFGNVISAIGLAKDRGKKSNSNGTANQYKANHFTGLLIALALFDLLYLVMGVLIFGLPTLSDWYDENVFPKLMPVR